MLDEVAEGTERGSSSEEEDLDVLYDLNPTAVIADNPTATPGNDNELERARSEAIYRPLRHSPNRTSPTQSSPSSAFKVAASPDIDLGSATGTVYNPGVNLNAKAHQRSASPQNNVSPELIRR